MTWPVGVETRRQRLVGLTADSIQKSLHRAGYPVATIATEIQAAAAELVDDLDDAGWLRRFPVLRRGDGTN